MSNRWPVKREDVDKDKAIRKMQTERGIVLKILLHIIDIKNRI